MGTNMKTIDERLVRAPLDRIYALAADVERWPALLSHYRYVRFRTTGIVEMSANRPFGPANWPTRWVSEMNAERDVEIRYRHIEGITTGMDVLWSFEPRSDGTHVRIVHEWDGPQWPLISGLAARGVIGPVFVHGIASRTLAGLAGVAERGTGERV
jgi:ribosome-associated toxin RatA of RatAB toxin-antitoxin module